MKLIKMEMIKENFFDLKNGDFLSKINYSMQIDDKNAIIVQYDIEKEVFKDYIYVPMGEESLFFGDYLKKTEIENFFNEINQKEFIDNFLNDNKLLIESIKNFKEDLEEDKNEYILNEFKMHNTKKYELIKEDYKVQIELNEEDKLISSISFLYKNKEVYEIKNKNKIVNKVIKKLEKKFEKNFSHYIFKKEKKYNNIDILFLNYSNKINNTKYKNVQLKEELPFVLNLNIYKCNGNVEISYNFNKNKIIIKNISIISDPYNLVKRLIKNKTLDMEYLENKILKQIYQFLKKDKRLKNLIIMINKMKEEITNKDFKYKSEIVDETYKYIYNYKIKSEGYQIHYQKNIYVNSGSSITFITDDGYKIEIINNDGMEEQFNYYKDLIKSKGNFRLKELLMMKK